MKIDWRVQKKSKLKMEAFQVVSDIHFDKYKGSNMVNFKPVAGADTLLIAGDLGRIENYVEYTDYIGYFCKLFENVILVPGNHEYYSTRLNLTFSYINDLLKKIEASQSNLHVLLDESIVINGIRIHGGTFWSFCPEGCMKKLKIHYRSSNSFITREEYNTLHYNAVEAVRNSIKTAEENSEDLIVVTHHAPTFEGVLKEVHRNLGHLKSPNRMYFSHNESLVEHPVVKKWVYGHTGYNGNYGKLVSHQVDAPVRVNNRAFNINPKKIQSKL